MGSAGGSVPPLYMGEAPVEHLFVGEAKGLRGAGASNRLRLRTFFRDF